MVTCLYKPKPCDRCRLMIQIGEECEYVPDTKTVRHWECGQVEIDPEMLADNLGYRVIGWDAIFKVLEGE